MPDVTGDGAAMPRGTRRDFSTYQTVAVLVGMLGVVEGVGDADVVDAPGIGTAPSDSGTPHPVRTATSASAEAARSPVLTAVPPRGCSR